MRTPDFYKIIDNEIEALLEKYKTDPYLVRSKKNIGNQKSYAFLIWFLETYGRVYSYVDYITEGDNDSSCDIVFDKTDTQGKRVFYVVQSKWNKQDNAEKETSRGEIIKALNEFETILRGDKQNVNDKLKTKLAELKSHLETNGEVKFIFLSLSEYRGGADDNITSFQKQDAKIDFEVIDINRIKNDYIERHYKQIEPINPLQTYYNPEEAPVSLRIERLSESNENFIKIERPFEAYVFLLRPKMIFELFEKYGFALFYKNVRNPLIQSQFNQDIKETAASSPSFFWYYNNGITAITYLMPAIGKRATQIEITGLQIINGGQTVYAIYSAYKEASEVQRKKMDTEGLITLRLLKSGGKDFDLDVTRYTNSQNPITDRDFYANDEVQLRLQQDSFQTNFWYEKRRDEFRELPEGVQKVSNDVFAKAYLAYQMQNGAALSNDYINRAKKDLNFVSHKDDKQGRYEEIFDRSPSFEAMLCAVYLYNLLDEVFALAYDKELREAVICHQLSFFKTIFSKYLFSKFGNTAINTNKQIIRLVEKGEIKVIYQSFVLIYTLLDRISSDDANQTKQIFSPSYHSKIKEDLEELEINYSDIENIDLAKASSDFDFSKFNQ